MSVAVGMLLFGACTFNAQNNESFTDTANTITIKEQAEHMPNTEESTFTRTPAFGSTESVKKTFSHFVAQGYIDTIDAKKRPLLSGNLQKLLPKEYKILASTQGDIFQNQESDEALITYNTEKQQVCIVLYDRLLNKLGLLYQDYKVVNGLSKADCSFSFAGTVDYLLMQELAENEDEIKFNGDSYLADEGNAGLQVTDLAAHKNIELAAGCFAPNTDKSNLKNSLVIAVSAVYADYLAFKFHKNAGYFELFYGQAFAD